MEAFIQRKRQKQVGKLFSEKYVGKLRKEKAFLHSGLVVYSRKQMPRQS